MWGVRRCIALVWGVGCEEVYKIGVGCGDVRRCIALVWGVVM